MYKITEVEKIDGISIWFSTVEEGNMSFKFDGKDKVLTNRSAFFNKIGVDIDKTVLMWGVHGNEVVEVNDKWSGSSVKDPNNAPHVDGLVTNKHGVYLALLIADCLPIILFDPVAKAVGLIHAGWRGSDQKILNNTISLFRDLYDSKPVDIKVFIGPCIRKDSYKFKSVEQEDDSRWKDYIVKTNDGNYMIDLPGFNKKELSDLGVSEDHIVDSGIDTAVDERFYSHFNTKNSSKDKGRFICVVGLA